MNYQKHLWAAGLLLSLNVVTAEASLIDRGNGMIYDNDLNITWLADANYGAGSGYDNGSDTTDGRMTWQNAVDWAANLVYGGYDDWRLPTTISASVGFNQTSSEMGHLFYSELGGVADTSPEGIGGTSIGIVHDADYNLFSNIQDTIYWSGSEFAQETFNAWSFVTFNGLEYFANKNDDWYAWAVRSGDVAFFPAQRNNVPEPGSLALLGLGLLALRRAKRR